MSYEFSLDKSVPITQCAYCGIAHPTMEAVTEIIQTSSYLEEDQICWRMYKCNSCGCCTMAQARTTGDYVQFVYPTTKEYDESIPERARVYLKQANETMHAPAASVMVTASAVDELLKSKGLTAGKLYPRIKEAIEKHMITDEMGAWAHEVRLEANGQRHADDHFDFPDADRARNMLGFAEALAEILFVLPSKGD